MIGLADRFLGVQLNVGAAPLAYGPPATAFTGTPPAGTTYPSPYQHPQPTPRVVGEL